jgi:hypothetical protein
MLHVVRCMLHATRTRCECSASALLGGSADRRGTRVYYVSTTRFPLPIRTDPLRYCTKGGSIAPSPQRCSGKTDHTYHPNRCCRRHHTHVSAQHHYHARHPARSHVLCCMSLVWFPLQVGQRAGTRAASGLRLAGAARPRGPKDYSQLRYCTALHCTMSAGYRSALRLLLKSSTAAYSLSIR